MLTDNQKAELSSQIEKMIEPYFTSARIERVMITAQVIDLLNKIHTEIVKAGI